VRNELTSVMDTYTYPAASNRLSSVTLGAGGSRRLTYDAAWNVTGDNQSGTAYTKIWTKFRG
jgi:hypothetical protein